MVEGTACVIVYDEVIFATQNEAVYLPFRCVHQMGNPRMMPVGLIEVQTGAYVGKDDIVRYEDVYARA